MSLNNLFLTLPRDSDERGFAHWAGRRGFTRLGPSPTRSPPRRGEGGSLIRQIESILGLIVGVVGGGEGGSTMPGFGPEERVDWAGPVIECVARVCRSILRHLEKVPFD